MTRYVLLLRGVNVGPTTKVPMARLRQLATDGLGWTGVSTYINSGNLVAECGASSPAAVEQALADALLDDLGRSVPVVARTHAQLQQVVSRNPFPDAQPQHLHVVFLDGRPSAEQRAAFDDQLVGHPERGVLIGEEAYIDFVNGAGRSKISWGRPRQGTGVDGTARNWNTVQQLLLRVDSGGVADGFGCRGV